jgi:hypothetical protein
MAHIFNYAVIMAVPNPRRGERVNIGVMIFLPDRVDVRFSELRKIRALQGGNWERRIADVQRLISQNYANDQNAEVFVETFSMLDGVIRCSAPAWFSIEAVEQYEQRVAEILSTLVQRPLPQRKPASTRINTEIARTFRQAKVLATPAEPVIGSGKVVRDLPISPEDELLADFGLKNGIYHVTATLDLRRANVDKGQAAIKAITLDRAGHSLDAEVRKIGVYAAPHGASQYRAHIHMLGEYADETYNWADPREQDAYLRSIYDAMRGGNFALKSN